jgi:Tfp pilus assembly protein PilE
MKTNNAHCPAAGIALVECLMYIALFSVLTAMAYSAYFRFQSQSHRLQQNAENIVEALQAGERWRDDIRHAIAQVRIEKNKSAEVLRIPQQNGEVTYIFQNNTVKRQRKGQGPVSVLKNLKSSAVQPDQRQQVTAWRWEIELQSNEKNLKVRPFFCFQAVPHSEK